MQITLENLKKKYADYEKAYFESLGITNANFGAMKAIEELIKEAQVETQTEDSHV